ncbi:MAG: apolipoprotein N-acyltransferase [Planctomycetota bacterium]|nr:MAG: apolipoprotein N-acyltransferase [Planctomycetota bacterium]
MYDQHGQWSRRYDKIHLVPFGEIVPFRNARFLGMSLHWLYRTLNRLSPFSDRGQVEYSLWPGEEFTVFELPMPDGSKARFGVPICYEDTVPEIPRRFVWESSRRRVDFLVNISNDGWFNHSAELEQHLAICTFRAVENRVGIARAVNTGVSGFIDPAGRLYSLVQVDGRLTGPGVVGYRVDHVKLDSRASLYGRWGDWFAVLCTLLTAALWLGGIMTRWVFAVHHWLVSRRARGVQSS